MLSPPGHSAKQVLSNTGGSAKYVLSNTGGSAKQVMSNTGGSTEQVTSTPMRSDSLRSTSAAGSFKNVTNAPRQHANRRAWRSKRKSQLASIMSSVDTLKGLNGLRAETAKVAVVDGCRVQAIDDADSEVGTGFVPVSDYSTVFTFCGTCAAAVMFLSLSLMPVMRFVSLQPTISEVLYEPQTMVELELPDIAVTVNIPNWSEGRLLDHVWPEFTMVNISNGFSNRADASAPVDVGFGPGDCDWSGGYNKYENDILPDSGPAQWPVFCVRRNSTSGERNLLSGRFGDPTYSYLSVSLHRCGCSTCINGSGTCCDVSVNGTGGGGGLSPRLADLWSGACSADGLSGWQFGPGKLSTNLWFRFPYEDWDDPGSLTAPNGVKSPVGMVRAPRGKWKVWVLEVVRSLWPCLSPLYLACLAGARLDVVGLRGALGVDDEDDDRRAAAQHSRGHGANLHSGDLAA